MTGEEFREVAEAARAVERHATLWINARDEAGEATARVALDVADKALDKLFERLVMA